LSDSSSKRPRTPGSGRRSTSSGDEAARAVQDVLRDQAERKERQRESEKEKKKRLLPLPVVALLWAMACLFVWAATPQFLLPEPLPEPTTTQVQAGLRMDMISVVSSVESFRGQTGRIPDALDPIMENPPTDVRYTRLAPDSYRITGERGGATITYQSGEPMKDLVGDVRQRIRAREEGQS